MLVFETLLSKATGSVIVSQALKVCPTFLFGLMPVPTDYIWRDVHILCNSSTQEHLYNLNSSNTSLYTSTKRKILILKISYMTSYLLVHHLLSDVTLKQLMNSFTNLETHQLSSSFQDYFEYQPTYETGNRYQKNKKNALSPLSSPLAHSFTHICFHLTKRIHIFHSNTFHLLPNTTSPRTRSGTFPTISPFSRPRFRGSPCRRRIL